MKRRWLFCMRAGIETQKIALHCYKYWEKIEKAILFRLSSVHRKPRVLKSLDIGFE